MSLTTRAPSKKLAVTIVAALIGALLIPAFASGQQVDPTGQQYDTFPEQAEDVTGTGTGADPGAPSADPGDPTGEPENGLSGRVGPLPFTGFDVLAMVAVALAVAGLGLALQRAVARPPNDGLS